MHSTQLSLPISTMKRISATSTAMVLVAVVGLSRGTRLGPKVTVEDGVTFHCVGHCDSPKAVVSGGGNVLMGGHMYPVNRAPDLHSPDLHSPPLTHPSPTPSLIRGQHAQTSECATTVDNATPRPCPHKEDNPPSSTASLSMTLMACTSQHLVTHTILTSDTTHTTGSDGAVRPRGVPVVSGAGGGWRRAGAHRRCPSVRHLQFVSARQHHKPRVRQSALHCTMRVPFTAWSPARIAGQTGGMVFRCLVTRLTISVRHLSAVMLLRRPTP
jgi:hypothetical protein